MRTFTKIFKTVFLATLFFSITVVFGQSPDKMSYQAVIRNASNALVTNANVSMRISIIQGSTSGSIIFQEIQTTTTNANGLASIEIGSVPPATGTLAGIDWSTGPYFIQTETDPTGGTAYSIVGTTELLSTPYALSAAGWRKNGNNVVNTNPGNLGIGTANPTFPFEVKTSNGKNAHFDGGNQLYITMSENGLNRGYIGSYYGNPEDVDFGTYDSNGTGSVHLTSGAQPRLTVISNGNTGIGTTTPTTKLEVNGFTKLGNNAPAIKVLKLTGTTASTQNTTTTVLHGVNPLKIISISVLVDSNSYLIPPSYNDNGYEYIYYNLGTSLTIYNSATNSFNILSKPIKVLITYEE